jgi:hypothetical protein
MATDECPASPLISKKIDVSERSNGPFSDQGGEPSEENADSFDRR